MNKLIVVSTLLLTACGGQYIKDGSISERDRDLAMCRSRVPYIAGQYGAVAIASGISRANAIDDCMYGLGYSYK